MSELSNPTRADRSGLGVREACIQEALNIIATDGIENLSLREVARRLSISHQAPYKHFPNREDLLAEVIGRAFDDFATFLHSRPVAEHPQQDLGEIGQRYLTYARVKPLQYRLMFETPFPNLHRHAGLEQKATAAFGLLHDAIRRLRGNDNPEANRELALFAWSTVHGLASITTNGALPAIGISAPDAQARAVEHVLAMICNGIVAPSPFTISKPNEPTKP